MAGIFISYRRDDTAGYAGWLYERLSARFGSDQVFMDVDSIEAGVDFVEIVQETVGKSGAVVALIGPQWLTVTDRSGRQRLDDPNDFVRIELRTALEKGVRVIPTLVHDAEVPRTEDLPPDLQPLVRRNAIELSDARFSYDVRRLIEALERILGHSGQGPLPAAGAVVPGLVPAAETTGQATAVPVAKPKRTAAVAGLRNSWLWVGAVAVLAAVIIGIAIPLAHLGSSPRQAVPPSVRPTQIAPATSTPVSTAGPRATRPPPTSRPAAAPTAGAATAVPATAVSTTAAPVSGPTTLPGSAPAITRPTAASSRKPASGPPTATSPPQPTATPQAPPAATTPPRATPVSFGTRWQSGLSGWSVGSAGAWTVKNSILSFDGSGIDQIIAPASEPGGPYLVQTRMRLVRCHGSQSGFGLYIRVPPGAAGGNAGIFAGTWFVNGRHLATIWSLTRGFYHQTFWRPFFAWHTYRVVVRGNVIRLVIDGKPYGAATVTELRADRQVGLGSLDCAIDVAGFRLASLK